MNAPVKAFGCEYCQKRFKSDEARSDHARAVHGIEPPAKLPLQADDPACSECGKIAQLVGGERIYPHRPDLYRKRFWLCECGAYCGCHGATTRPLGFPAGAATRRARLAAHDAFDPLWRGGPMGRREAYTWLSREMGLTPEQTHIGMMTAAQAWRVVELCRERRSIAA